MAPIEQPVKVTANTTLTEAQTDKILTGGWIVSGVNGGLALYENYAKHDLAMGMIDLQMDAQNKDYQLKGKLMDLNETLIGSQERIAIKQLTTTKEIAELQKDQNVAIAQAKVNGAVKIAKVNALNSQFYGQPVQSNLHS